MKKITALAATTFACLLLISTAAQAANISDQGHFFSEETISKAKTEIERLQNKYHHDVVVETFATVPDSEQSKYSAEAKNAFFEDWFKERARQLNITGLYILICKDPAHLQVGASSQLYKAGYSTADRDSLKNTLLDNFRQKKYDEGLSAALSVIGNNFDEMSRSHPTSGHSGGSYAPYNNGSDSSSGSGGMGWLGWALILVGVYFAYRLLTGMFRGAMASGPGGYGPGYGPGYGGAPGMGGGGGGFFSSMLGGMFGGMAGNWLSNRWSDSSAGAPPAGPTAPSDYSSTGGDFGGGGGGGGGGGDFGPSDGGGGGGGGSDGGGAGGDF